SHAGERDRAARTRTTIMLNLWSGWIQLGFAGFAAIVFVAFVWLVKEVIRVIGNVTKVVSANTATIAALGATLGENKTLSIEIKDKLLESPCMLPDEVRGKVREWMKDFEKRAEQREGGV
ncbi:MAG: hypothetical protein LLG00_15920, partial [Planctomycetaceae bacterium]|nr:hypothetical protein [Planctomycetaceae bacterium]